MRIVIINFFVVQELGTKRVFMTPLKCGVAHVCMWRKAWLGLGFNHCLIIGQWGGRGSLLAVEYQLIYIFTLLQLHCEQKQGFNIGLR